jgi:orotidine-5'-phosphate decarboxylase
MGYDSVQPFIEYASKGVFVLCRTSNPGGREFQSLLCGERPLYEHVALKAKEWNTNHNIGFVTGSTHPQEIGRIRELCADMPLLVPGIGAQSGNLEASVKAGIDRQSGGVIISASRHALYASEAKDFAEAARGRAQALREAIHRASVSKL